MAVAVSSPAATGTTPTDSEKAALAVSLVTEAAALVATIAPQESKRLTSRAGCLTRRYKHANAQAAPSTAVGATTTTWT